MSQLNLIISGIMFVLALFPGIGPQNLNTMSHGIKKNFAYTVATTCFISDGLLIILGGFGIKVFHSHLLLIIINVCGAIFITFYLFIKLKNLFQPYTAYQINSQKESLKISILRALALTWFNPLVFIDTIVVVGGIASRYEIPQWYYFIIGTIIGDFIWQYGLVFISGKFSHKLNQVPVWITLDIITVFILVYVLYKTILIMVT